ncbi:hypothetical protein E2P81_ATG10428 [Venturia nashicola]|nr:hypothetical protein E2P81_ATG10428 [Venturia nashicola]
MVNRGRSTGCHTCKQRRVKCDEAKPECRTCQRLGLCCPGYCTRKYAKIRFQDETHKFAVLEPVPRVRRGASFDMARLDGDAPVLFYLTHYAGMGRDMGSTRGFFELLLPAYTREPAGSALSLAVSTLAAEVYAMWQQDPTSFRSPRHSYHRAISRLRTATQHPVERGKPATVLAALVLQTYENVCAIYGLRWASSTHHAGAASLLRCVESDDTDETVRDHLRRFMLHTEVSKAMRQQTPVDNAALSWINAVEDGLDNDNPSAALDVIAISLAKLQAACAHHDGHSSLTPPPELVLQRRMAEAKKIETALLAWATLVPDHWTPVRLKSGKSFDSSISSFHFTCETYPTCQIASIWNLWRCQRLLLAKITFGILDLAKLLRCSDTVHGIDPVEIPTRQSCQVAIQEMIDGMCYSIPFYLGNRTTRCSLEDFTNSSVAIPGSPLPTTNERIGIDNFTSTTWHDAYRRHIIAQGPWRAMHPLSRLMTLFSEDKSDVYVKALHPGQREWIRDQWLRVAVLLHLPQSSQDAADEHGPPSPSADARAESLAFEMRKGAILMSGP